MLRWIENIHNPDRILPKQIWQYNDEVLQINIREERTVFVPFSFSHWLSLSLSLSHNPSKNWKYLCTGSTKAIKLIKKVDICAQQQQQNRYKLLKYCSSILCQILLINSLSKLIVESECHHRKIVKRNCKDIRDQCKFIECCYWLHIGTKCKRNTNMTTIMNAIFIKDLHIKYLCFTFCLFIYLCLSFQPSK